MGQVCKNCGHYFSGLYCNQCGQKVAHRLDVKHVVHEAVHVFTHADKGIFPLIPAVLFRPGLVALDYVQGRRKRYFSIFQYLLIIVGVATYIVTKRIGSAKKEVCWWRVGRLHPRCRPYRKK